MAQTECFAAGLRFARTEGIIPAPEPTHALAASIREALGLQGDAARRRFILTALCGHGHFDMPAYDRYLSGEMEDLSLPQEQIDTALAGLPVL